MPVNGPTTAQPTAQPTAQQTNLNPNLLSGSINFVIGSIDWTIDSKAFTGTLKAFIFAQQVFEGDFSTTNLVLDADGDIGFAKLDARLTVTWATGVDYDVKESLKNSDGTWSNWEQQGKLISW